MQYYFAPLALSGLVSAGTIPQGSCACKFTLTASGGQSGIIGQLSDGQNRVGGGNPIGEYCISNGEITDSQGRGCILTPPTSQFQCDNGATPTGGFSLGSNGQVEHNGSPKFYACPATENAYNIYTVPVEEQTKCVEIELTASGCYAQSSSMKPAPPVTQSPPVVEITQAPVTVTVTQTMPAVMPPPPASPKPAPPSKSSPPAPFSTGKSCPVNLNGAYQYPHLIIPVSKSHPNDVLGTSYNGTISREISSIYNFDIPYSDSGKTCSLIFLFPEQAHLQTSSYTFSGPGTVDFVELSTVATEGTSYASMGRVKYDFGTYVVKPGSGILVGNFQCPAGEAVSFLISSVWGTSLEYMQDYNPSPIGLYVVSC